MMKKRGQRQLFVRALSAAATRGFVELGPLRLPCALGRSGVRARKFEGDGATPLGQWRLEKVYYRGDRLLPPRTGLPVQLIRPNDGWCDDAGDRNYNRLVRRPYPASAETLWRDDGLYDAVVLLDYNFKPRVRKRGSAIFMHVARDGLRPTEGCIAVSRPNLLKLLRWLRCGDAVVAQLLRAQGGARPRDAVPGSKFWNNGRGFAWETTAR